MELDKVAFDAFDAYLFHQWSLLTKKLSLGCLLSFQSEHRKSETSPERSRNIDRPISQVVEEEANLRLEVDNKGPEPVNVFNLEQHDAQSFGYFSQKIFEPDLA